MANSNNRTGPLVWPVQLIK